MPSVMADEIRSLFNDGCGCSFSLVLLSSRTLRRPAVGNEKEPFVQLLHGCGADVKEMARRLGVTRTPAFLRDEQSTQPRDAGAEQPPRYPFTLPLRLRLAEFVMLGGFF